MVIVFHRCSNKARGGGIRDLCISTVQSGLRAHDGWVRLGKLKAGLN